MTPRLHCRPRRRTHRTGCVTIGEPNTSGSEPIDMGGLVKITPLAGKIHPSHVINEDENEIGRAIFRKACDAEEK